MPLDEPLSSFIRRRDEYSPSNGTIKPRTLMPRANPRTGRIETSVCRSGQLSEQDLWAVCTQYFDASQTKPAIGHCVGPSMAVFAAGLDIDPDGHPYAQHANIIGWPAGDEGRHERMNRTQCMAG